MEDEKKLIETFGATHVIRPEREDPQLLARLDDDEVLELAASMLGDRDQEVRRSGLMMLEWIGWRRHDQKSAELLLCHAQKAKQRHEIGLALECLSALEPPELLPGAPLVELSRRKDWQIWCEAITCLHLADPDEVEIALLEKLDDAKFPERVAFELRYMTSDQSLKALETLIDSGAGDARSVALMSLEARLGRGALPFARRLAESRSFHDKYMAEGVIAKHGEADDVPFMAKRLGSLTSSSRRKFSAYPTEASMLVPFLLRQNDERAAAALRRMGEKRERMERAEREWIEDHHPELFIGAGAK